jgi:restriction system protein
VRLRDAQSTSESSDVPSAEASPQLVTASPDDRLEEALSEIRRTVSAEVIEALRQVSPTFFETIVLDVLHRMGYGASRADLQRVGGTADGGIEGIIKRTEAR